MKLPPPAAIFALLLLSLSDFPVRAQFSTFAPASKSTLLPQLLEMVPIQSVDPTIQIDLKYKSADNITGKPIYPPGFQALLRRGVAIDLRNAQNVLRRFGYGLKVWDAWRPIYAQKALYAANSDTRFVADPGQHPMHNRGIAVDVTLVDLISGRELPMPTAFDVMNESADFFYKGGNQQILRRLQILQTAMMRNGFYATRTEWWHFVSLQWKQYPDTDAALSLATAKPSPTGISAESRSVAP